MFLINLLLSTTSFITLILGLLVLVSNPRKRVNQALSFFIFSVFLWMFTNLLTNLSANSGTALIFARATLVGAALIPFAFVLFVKSYLDVKLQILNIVAWAILPITLLLFTPTRYNIVSIGAYGADTKTGEVYALLILELLAYFVYGFARLYSKYRSKSTSERQRQQIKFIFIGVISSFVPALIINAILPLMTGDTQVILYGPNVMFLLAAFMTVAIVRHRFLNIKLVVARSLGYLLSVGSLAILYGVIAFTVIDTFIFSATTSDVVKQAIYTLLAVILAFTFQPLKKFFDKWSNRLFYRDAYDSQELLDGLNKILVSTLDINKLLKNSANVINQSIKAEFVVFGIKQIEESPQRIIGTSDRQFTQEDIEQVRQITPRMHQKSIVVDELEDKESKLRDLLRKNDIAVLTRLTDTPTKNQEGIGYIVLGAKKSGSPYSRQDLQVLEIIADELVIAVQNALRFEEIQNFNITLQDKVDDATKKLRAANHRLVELDQTKDDFISMASHQLRTPLTSIKGYVSMVMEGDAGKISKKQAELLDQAFVSSQRMVYLIADLLNVSRLRTGKFVIEPKETNLAEVIEGEISQLKETAKGRDLELVFNKPTSFPNLMLDETKIRQVIMNFADNAIYYTPSGGHIKVALEDKGDSVEFTVTDDGIGVPKSEQHHLFGKFYRAGNAKKARPDGTGLGLFMAKKVVVAQGGSIIFKTQEGKGSTFGFAFTKKPLLPEHFKGIVTAEKSPKT